MPKLGAMKKAYIRVAETGKVYSDASRKYNHDDRKGYEEDGNIWDFLIPMVVLVALAIITSDLLTSVVAAILVCFVLYVPRKIVPFEHFFEVIVKGFADMLSILMLLVIAFMLQKLTEKMGMTDFIVTSMEPLLRGAFFPAIAFVLVALLCFATGSFWGMSAVVAPIVFPLGAAIGANHGCHYFRRRIRKPCLLLCRCHAFGINGSRYRKYGTFSVPTALCAAGEWNQYHPVCDLWSGNVKGGWLRWKKKSI